MERSLLRKLTSLVLSVLFWSSFEGVMLDMFGLRSVPLGLVAAVLAASAVALYTLGVDKLLFLLTFLLAFITAIIIGPLLGVSLFGTAFMLSLNVIILLLMIVLVAASSTSERGARPRGLRRGAPVAVPARERPHPSLHPKPRRSWAPPAARLAVGRDARSRVREEYARLLGEFRRLENSHDLEIVKLMLESAKRDIENGNYELASAKLGLLEELKGRAEFMQRLKILRMAGMRGGLPDTLDLS